MIAGMKNRYSLFEVTGIELEYMIVDRETLAIKPICDELLSDAAGKHVSEFKNGNVSWCNEIVNHVVELKTNDPVTSLNGLANLFHENVLQVNRVLLQHGAMLLPSGMHPWMNPYLETSLWKHDQSEIYELYNRLFDCRGHGWSNLQSTHLNLPFGNDEEFARLHAAIRLVLPLIPALSASSPLMDGRFSGFVDGRLEVYRRNQEKMPSITGKVIPEAVFSEEAYLKEILMPIVRDITPFDDKGVLDKQFVNSRGAIARFDRGAIEIRIIDIQESPRADMAIVEAVTSLVRLLVEEKLLSLEKQKRWHEDNLLDILLLTIKDGEDAIIPNSDYARVWGLHQKTVTAREIWEFMLPRIAPYLSSGAFSDIKFIIENGTLSNRIIKSLNHDFSIDNQRAIYRRVASSLVENTLFAFRP